jgi:hypothetical protein
MSGPQEKINPFKPVEPVIPGVPQKPAAEEKAEGKPAAKPETKIVWPPPPPPPRPLWQMRSVQVSAGAGAVLLLCGAALAWRALRTEPAPVPVMLETPAAAPDASASASQPAAPQIPVAPGPVASVAALAKPWSVATFRMQRPSGETVKAMVIRLPSSPGYWGLLSVAPYGQCDLAVETDLKKLREQYSYAAIHPMVVDSCTQTVYDPLALGSSGGVWIRGRIAAGPGIRPPFEVEIKVEKDQVVASRSE